jgi:hypothetical protein
MASRVHRPPMAGSSDPPTLGPCCVCETQHGVRNIVCLDMPCPTPGRGWGCVVCDVPCNGAVAVLCDTCLKLTEGRVADIDYVCTGHPATDGRTPMAAVSGVFGHDMLRHPEAS